MGVWAGTPLFLQPLGHVTPTVNTSNLEAGVLNSQGSQAQFLYGGSAGRSCLLVFSRGTRSPLPCGPASVFRASSTAGPLKRWLDLCSTSFALTLLPSMGTL